MSEVFLAQYSEERMRELIKEDSFEDGMEKGREEGREEGIREGRLEAIIELLTEIGEVTDTLKEKLYNETDAIRLKEMLRYSAKARSIKEFSDKFEL